VLARPESILAGKNLKEIEIERIYDIAKKTEGRGH